jgi:hypothetical protein
LSGNGGCKCRNAENEFCQSFHIFNIVVLLFWRPVIEPPSPNSSQSVSGFLQLFDALTARMALCSLEW